MNVRYLLAIPVFFAASITAAACSSSSSPTTTANPDCATLSACCSSLGTSAAACATVVSAGGANCTAQLASEKAAGNCNGGTTGPGSGTGVGPTGSGSGTGVTTSGSGSGTHSSGSGSGTHTSGSGSGSGTAVACAPQPVTGMTFTAPAFPATGACTAAQESAIATDCFGTSTSDAAAAACQGAINTSDGALDPCGNCLIAGQKSPTWGAFTAVDVPIAVGSTMVTELDFFDTAACIAAVDPSSTGKACAAALATLQLCEYAACLSVCPVVNQMDTAGQAAAFGSAQSPGCAGNADTSVCMTQATALNTACMTESNDAGTGAFDKCIALENAATKAGAPTTALEGFVGTICGGFDGGA